MDTPSARFLRLIWELVTCSEKPTSIYSYNTHIISISLHDRPWIAPWIKSIFNKWDIIFQVIASQLSEYCNVINYRLWRHQQNVNSRYVRLGHFSCDQAALWIFFYPSVRPSHLFDYVPIIRSSWNFQELLPMTKVGVHAKGRGQRSKVEVTEVTTQLNRFRTVTLVWIHIWWWNDAYSLMLPRRGALQFFKVIRQISGSHGSKNRRIWPKLGVSGL